MRLGGGGEASKTVAAFEDRQELAFGVFFGEFEHGGGERGEVLIGELEAAQRVAVARIEAGREDDELGLEFGHGRNESIAKGGLPSRSR